MAEIFMFPRRNEPVLTIPECVDRFIEFQNRLRVHMVAGSLSKEFLDEMDRELAFLEQQLERHGKRIPH